MKLTFSAIIAVCIALAEAVPSAKRDMDCKSTGRSGRLIGHNSATGAKSIFEFNSTDNLSTLHEVLKTDQEFEFYSCKAPSNEFAGAGFGAAFGQIRSKKDPDMCVTSGSIVIGGKDKGEPEFLFINNGRVTLEKCAKDGMTLRRQWFAASQGVPQCPPTVSLLGYQSDVPQNFIGINKDGTAHLEANLYKNMDEYFYLARDVSDSCK